MTAAKEAKKHPLAGQSMSGADIILEVLANEGVDTIFGYSGGAILPTYDAIFRYNKTHGKAKQVKLIVPANEQGAGFMAAGYARATGKVGLLMVTSGPGATNCATPIRDCMADSIPVVMISGQVATAAIGSDAFQEAPVYSIMSACAKHVFLVSKGEELEETIRTAFKIARSGRPGPVVIDVPKDVQNWSGTFKGEGTLNFRGYNKRIAELAQARLSKEERDRFLKLLKESKRPLIYAGGGVINSNAAAELRQFSNRFGIPVVTTLMGIGGVDMTDDLCLHMLGMHGTPYANYAVQDCDLLIAVGARFDDRVAGNAPKFAERAKIAHIDIDAAEIGKVKRADWCHVGDAKMALKDLMAAGKNFDKNFAAWQKHVKKLKKDHALQYKQDTELIQPQEVMSLIGELTDGEAIVCTGVGQHQMWAAQYSRIRHARGFITSGSMGTMGFGLPAAIGAQLACPDKTVIDVDGDGSMRMNLGELETATTYGVPVKVLLLNNLGDGMVRQWQRLYFDERYSATDKSLHKKDFVKAAEADGFGFAKRVTRREDLKKTLKEWLAAEGPAFLEVMIDTMADVYPMVGPGLGYDGMLVGPYIKPRETGEVEAKLDTSDAF